MIKVDGLNIDDVKEFTHWGATVSNEGGHMKDLKYGTL